MWIATSRIWGPDSVSVQGMASLLPKTTVIVNSSAESRLQSRYSPEFSVRTSCTTRGRWNTPTGSPRAATLALGRGTPVNASVTTPPTEVSPSPSSAEHQADRMVAREGMAR